MKPNLKTLVTALGFVRIGVGLAYAFTPKVVSTASYGPGSNTPELSFTSKLYGSREVYMGVTVVAAAQSMPQLARAVLISGSIADAWDAFAALTTRGTKTRTKTTVSAVALTASTIGAYLATRPQLAVNN